MVMATNHRRSRLQLKLAPQVAAAVKNASGNLEITEIVLFRIHEPGSGREYCVLRVKTRSGLVGYGESARASKEDLTAAQQFWVGRPATAYAIAPIDLPETESVRIVRQTWSDYISPPLIKQITFQRRPPSSETARVKHLTASAEAALLEAKANMRQE